MADSGYDYAADTDMCDCDLEPCRREFLRECNRYHAGEDPLDDAAGYNVQHCQHPGCHNRYLRGKNGGDCAECCCRVCEGCQGDFGGDDEDGEWICDECMRDENNNRARNRRRHVS